jgi:hypothetical protein
MPEPKLQVPVVVGTRPEAIKLVSLILALRESESYNPIVVSTGQHNRMVEYIFELAGIKPDVTLWAGSRRAALNERVSSVMRRFEDFCVERFDIDPDATPTHEDVLAGRQQPAGDRAVARSDGGEDARLRAAGRADGLPLHALLARAVFFYLLAFGGTSLGCIAARSEERPIGWVVGFPDRAGLHPLHLVPLAGTGPLDGAAAAWARELGEDGARGDHRRGRGWGA